LVELSHHQIAGLAPDAASIAAGKKLSASKHWRDLGRSPAAMWGQCQGSALYQVKIDLGQPAYNCTCPSRKLPCKHVLGLMMLSADVPVAFAATEPPEWVVAWLEKREATAKKRAEKKEASPKPVDAAAQAKRAAQREEKVLAGLARLDLWLDDLVRNGLAGLERSAASIWETEARRLVDAQAGALAARVSQLAEIPGARPDWPHRLLAQLGRLALLTHAYRRMSELSESLRAEVRQLIGWTISQDELSAHGELVEDEWLFLSQETEDEGRIRVQRNWLIGRQSGRTALVLQFSAGGQPFPEAIAAGTQCHAQLTFYPGAWPERAAIKTRLGDSRPIMPPLPGARSICEFLDGAARAVAKQPWLVRMFGVLRDVRPIPIDVEGDAWCVADSGNAALPLVGPRRMELLARSGGQPIDLAGIWNGSEFRPLGVRDDSGYHPL
jgi:hypothetical protein